MNKTTYIIETSNTYDAAGTKLRKVAYDNSGVLISRTEYIGGIQYESLQPLASPPLATDLKFMSTGEGRVVKEGSNWNYEYYHKDHLGNTRVVYSYQKQVDEYKATMETQFSTKEEGHVHGGKDGYAALQIQTLAGGVDLPAVGNFNPATGMNFVRGVNIHKAGVDDYTGTFWKKARFNRHGDVGKMFAHRYSGVSEGCQLIKVAQWKSFMSNFSAEVGKIGTIISRSQYSFENTTFQNPDKSKIEKYTSDQD